MSFRLKTICGIAAIEALLLCLLIAGDLDSLRRSNMEQLAKRAASTAELFASLVKEDVLTMNLASLQNATTGLCQTSGVVYARINSSRYGLLAHSEDEPAVGEAERHGASDARADIMVGGVVYGYVVVGLSDASIAQLLAATRTKSLTTGAVGMLLSALFSWLLGTYLTRQLGSLTQASEAIARRRFDQRVPVKGRDELAKAAEAFNHMSEELRNTYDELSEKAANFRSFYDTVDAFLMVVAPDGHIVDANAALLTQLGYTAEELTRRDVFTLFDLVGQTRLRRHIETLGHAHVASLTIPMQSRSGNLLLVEMRIVRGLWNGRPAYFAIGKDVSALHRSEERFRSIADFTYDWEYWLAPDGRFEWVAPACLRITGYPPQRFLRDTAFLESIVHPDDRSILSNHLRQAPDRTLTPCTVTFRLRRADGQEIWIEHNCRPIFDSTGQFIGRRGCNRDVTERKRNADAMEAAREAAEAANQAKSQFLATVSHEIRTPLNGIIGMLQLLDTGDLPTEHRDTVALALESSEKLLTILNDILDIARIEAGKVVLCHETVDPGQLLAGVAGIFKGNLQHRGLAFNVTADASLPPAVVTDEGRLRQILFNLIGNAAKFTPQGSIEVWGGALPVASLAGTIRLLFVISDTGIGIADEQVERIFNRFCQVDDRVSRRYGGLGLGLAIVHRFVGLLGGCVCVESECGNGSIFYVTIETALPPNDALPVAASLPTEPATPAQALSVLVVEDERINQITMRKFLEKLGHHPTMANNGQEALDLLGRTTYDLILMDIQMPILDGEETTRRIRDLGTDRATIPIIALTAHAMKGDRERFLACGMSGYLSKPVDFKALRETIDTIWTARPAGPNV